MESGITTELDAYIYNYLGEHNLFQTAKTFLEEKKFEAHVEIFRCPGGLLSEWWSVFWEFYVATTNNMSSPLASTYSELYQENVLEQQKQAEMNYRFVQPEQMQQRDARLAN